MAGSKDISICLFVSFVGLVVCQLKPDCSSANGELQPHINPNMYWYCGDAASDPIELICPDGRGFLKNDERSGCVPFADWKCTTKDKPPTCITNEEYSSLHRHTNPNKYWACPQPQGTTAIETYCPFGQGFVKHDAHMGCVPFDLWVCDKNGDTSRN